MKDRSQIGYVIANPVAEPSAGGFVRPRQLKHSEQTIFRLQQGKRYIERPRQMIHDREPPTSPVQVF
jgi:hypothetical protein